MKANSQQSFLFRFKFSSKQFPLPTQFRSFPLTYSTTCSTQTLPQLQFKPRMLPDASEKSKSTFPNRWYPHVSFSFTPLSTNSLNTKFHCAFSAMTVPISLSLSTPVPILPGKQQCFRLQSQGHQSVRTSVKPHCSCTLSNLRCSTTHIFISQMWQINQGHWQSKLDPPGSHAKVSLSNYHLQAWRQAQ